MKKFLASLMFSFCIVGTSFAASKVDTSQESAKSGFTATHRVSFGKYRNPVFVETGTYHGDSVEMALREGFPLVYSIELSKPLYDYCVERFRGNSRVKLFNADSGTALYEIIKDINKRITFWLDGHYSRGDTARTEQYNTPILGELDQIKKHHIKTHTILIDDMRCCNTALFDFVTKEQIIAKIKEINPRYTITYENGCEPNDILVARVRRCRK